MPRRGSGTSAGSWLGKRIVIPLSTPAFVRTVEILLAASGILTVLGV